MLRPAGFDLRGGRERLGAPRFFLMIFVAASLASCAGKGIKGSKPEPAWIHGSCQDELARRKVLGLCSTVALTQGIKPKGPREMAAAVLQQGKEQLAVKVSELTRRVVDDCLKDCGNLTDPKVRTNVRTRLVAAALKDAHAVEVAWGKDGNLYGLVSVDLGAFARAIESDPDLDEQARQAMLQRARDVFEARKT